METKVNVVALVKRLKIMVVRLSDAFAMLNLYYANTLSVPSGPT